MKLEEVLKVRDSAERLKKMKPVLDRISEGWGKWLPEPGWDDLLLALDAALSVKDPDYVIFQAKEKFGTLRFYAEVNNPEVGQIIVNVFENASRYFCEYCGSTDKVFARPMAWVKTLCDECAKDAGWVLKEKK